MSATHSTLSDWISCLTGSVHVRSKIRKYVSSFQKVISKRVIIKFDDIINNYIVIEEYNNFEFFIESSGFYTISAF